MGRTLWTITRRMGRAAGALLLGLGAGCASGGAGITPEQAQAELMALPGGTMPVELHCREQADFGVRQLPIQLRNELASSTAASAYAACMEVLTVFVSVAMVQGDSTADGLAGVREMLEGLDSQALVDSCDVHHRSWRLLQTGGESAWAASGNETPSQAAQYEGWIDRCFAVLRLFGGSTPGS